MVPLVGWLPLQPPDAVQLCASFALHCKIVEVPMATLVFVAASVTDGFAATLAPGAVKAEVSADDDCPHADKADSAANARSNCNGRENLMKRDARRSRAK